MKKVSKAYVLVTCLFVLAVLSVSAMATMHSASLMAQHSRALEISARRLQDAHDALQLVETSLLNGEPQDAGAGLGCETGMASRVRVSRLHERSLDGGDEKHAVKWMIYGLQACQEGRAVMEATLGVVQPVGMIEESAMPQGVKVGRLSWRRVW